MKRCPECNDVLIHPSRCDCGWKEPGIPGAPEADERCRHCGKPLASKARNDGTEGIHSSAIPCKDGGFDCADCWRKYHDADHSRLLYEQLQRMDLTKQPGESADEYAARCRAWLKRNPLNPGGGASSRQSSGMARSA